MPSLSRQLGLATRYDSLSAPSWAAPSRPRARQLASSGWDLELSIPRKVSLPMVQRVAANQPIMAALKRCFWTIGRSVSCARFARSNPALRAMRAFSSRRLWATWFANQTSKAPRNTGACEARTLTHLGGGLAKGWDGQRTEKQDLVRIVARLPTSFLPYACKEVGTLPNLRRPRAPTPTWPPAVTVALVQRALREPS